MRIPIISEWTDEVRVSFRHALQRNGKSKPFTRATVSWITKDGTYEYEGLAIVHPNDAPVRKVGRKIALARALQASGLPKDERRQVWMGLLENGMRV